MPVNPRLVTARGSQFHVFPFADDESVLPATKTITVTAAAAVGATSLTVTVTGAATTDRFYEGQILVAAPKTVNSQYVYVAANSANSAPATITVEPLRKAIAANAVITSFLGLPIIGLEAANMQLQSEVNQAVLLANEGWQVTDASTGSFQFSGNLYVPRQAVYLAGFRSLKTAFLNKSNVYVERFLPNGQYNAGVGIITDMSDTVQGSAYVTNNLTIQGSNRPVDDNVLAVPV
jgi:hypothetical protein